MPAAAQPAVVEFSADTVETDQQQGTRTGKLYMGNNRIRTEFEMNGKTMIQIMDLDKQQAFMINPEERTYMRLGAGQGGMQAGGSAPESMADPCAGMQNISCRKLGVEKINGRSATKWEIGSTAEPDSEPMVFWIDEERKFPVRQEMPDGSTMELNFVRKESVDGRVAEKWVMTMTRPGGHTMTSTQWYDPELKINIREDHGDEYSRVLKNIKPGKQPDSLFIVPEGYREISTEQ
ncbi:MAG: DUF4412 domain-containing protein [Gammaproteobacteria bacterium]